MDWRLFILVCMIFMHIVDDYYLQGWLASAKQKKWWKENCPDKKYNKDYLVALFMHSFSWAFMIMLIPTLITQTWLPILFFINIAIHMYTDNEKANKFSINLVQDQTIHMVQIITTWIVMMYI